MDRRTESWLEHVEENLKFLAELGVGFVPAGDSKARPRDTLLSLHEKILNCRLCPLAGSRTRAVPGEGDFDTDLMFVGEAPGADEDAQGRPFVGRAGQLLTKIIEAMQFRREEVFITNVVKCRPPENRTPFPEEIEKCRGYLLGQIEAIQPKVIVTLGKVATEFFVPLEASMANLRGKFYESGKILVMPTYHPSYVLRNEGNKAIKKLVWQDMQKVMAVLSKQ
ncbi:MAG: uracil-DNA glycosylase [Candidatus Aminicenantes bacterium]|nr:uracil-DNA glycosylase [Candidatus Aminicenantes bacterium]